VTKQIFKSTKTLLHRQVIRLFFILNTIVS